MQTPKIFLSYSWANSAVADEIDSYFQKYGISLVRDVRDVEYRADLKDYMGRIQETDYVIMLIGHDFLTSENCMFEMLRMISVKDFEKRILPVNIGDAKFYNATQRAVYYKLWKERIAATRQQSIEYETTDFAEQLKHQKDIHNNLPDFFTRITALNLKTFEELKKLRYQPIFKILGFNDMEFLEKLVKAADIDNTDLKLTALELLSLEYGPSFLVNFQKAVVYKNDKKYNLSRLFFTKATQDGPMYANLYNDFGLLLEHQFKEIEAARTAYEFALKIDPSHDAATLNLINLIEDHDKDPDKVRGLWEAAIERNPKNLKFKVNLARLLSQHYREHDQALALFEDALSQNPDYFKGLIGIAHLLSIDLHRPLESIPFYQRALQMESNHVIYIEFIKVLATSGDKDQLEAVMKEASEKAVTADVFLACADASAETLKNYKAAKKYYLKAIRADYRNAKAYNVYGAFLEYKIKDYSLARKAYENALRLNPENDVYHYNYAYIVDWHFHDFELARRHYELSIKYDPKQFDAYLNLGELLIRNNHGKEAVKYLEKAIIIDSHKPLPYINLAYYYQDAEPLRAKAMFEQALKYLPDNSDHRSVYAEVLAALGEIEVAKTEFKRATADGSHPDAVMRYLVFLINRKEYETGERFAKRVIEQQPNESYPYVNYTTLLIILRRLDEAEKILTDLLQQYDDIPEVHYNLALVYQIKEQSNLYEKHINLARQYGLDDQVLNYKD